MLALMVMIILSVLVKSHMTWLRWIKDAEIPNHH